MSEDQVDQPKNVKHRQSDTPKVSVALKRLWHAACFQPRDKKGAGRIWRKLSGQWMTLKAFAAQAKTLGKVWNDNKDGDANKDRSDANLARISAERAASHSSRGK